MILPCECKHTFQDSRYGKGMRVHNRSKNKGTGVWTNARCTVCGIVKNDVGAGKD